MPTTGGVGQTGVPVGNLGAPNYNYAYREDDPAGRYSTNPVPLYANQLDGSIQGTPDPMRTGAQRTVSYRPAADQPPENFYTHGLGAERLARHQAENLDGDGWLAQAPAVRQFAPNPRNQVYAEPRATSRMAPSSYAFTRPYDQTTEHQNNGQHFSMADHRRRYAILGMRPVDPLRNTDRHVPAPWDYDTADVVEVAQAAAQAQRIVAYDIPQRRW